MLKTRDWTLAAVNGDAFGETNMSSKVAVITGASAGIGMETALAFARRGYAVVLAARREDRLRQVAEKCRGYGTEALVAPTDVAQEEQVDALVESAMEQFRRIDVMVNNAGYGVHARVHETSDEQMRRIFDVNYFGVFYGCKAVAPIMIRQRSGHIFNISSVIGRRGSPFNGAYSATKFAIRGLTESMRVEMSPYDVRVTCVCPGLTETDFWRHVDGGKPKMQSSFKALRSIQPASHVARKIVAAVGKNKPEMVFTPGGKFLALISALSPRLTDYLMRLYHDELTKSP